MHPLNPTHLRTIHPTALAELGEGACIVALGIARDLRSGVIPPEEYNQRQLCGTACCIAGHIASRMNIPQHDFLHCLPLLDTGEWPITHEHLFNGHHPSDPILAADAIERYVYDGSQMPWVAK